jgi:transcriptional regulator with XRE-family HTH domain
MKKKSLLEKAKSAHDLPHRDWLGVSQKEYADFCGVSKSLLSMIEQGHRTFPNGKSDEAIVRSYAEAETQNPDISAFEKKEAYHLRSEEKQYHALGREKSRLELVLKIMPFKHLQCSRMLKTCLFLRQKITDTQSPKYKLFVKWEGDARKNLLENTPVKQELLQIQLEAIKKQMAVLERERDGD